MNNVNSYSKYRAGGRVRYRPNQFNERPITHTDRPRHLNFVDEAFKLQHPTTTHDPTKYSDETPTDRSIDGYKVILRRRKLYISDLKKGANDTAYNFSVDINDKQKHIRAIKFIHLILNYTATATPITSAFILLPDFKESETTTDGHDYHMYIPVDAGANGADVVFSYDPDHYITDFNLTQSLENKIRVELFKENSTNGDIEPFTELNSISFEIEIIYVDHADELTQSLV